MVVRRLFPGRKAPSLVERSGIPPARIIIRVHYASRAELLADALSDLGEGGLLLRTELDLDLGARVTLELSCPFLDVPLLLDGVVRFKRGAEQPGVIEQDEAVVGIELSRRDAEQQRAVDRFESLLHESAERVRKLPHVPE